MIDLGIRQAFLYSAVSIRTKHAGAGGGVKVGGGTGFLVGDGGSEAVLVTNRHVLERDFKNAKWIGYDLVGVALSGHQHEAGAVTPFEIIIQEPVPYLLHPSHDLDVAIVPIVGAAMSGLPSLRVPFLHTMLARSDEFGEDISVGDFVVISGFPKLEGEQVKTPLLMPGIVASDPSQTIRVRETEYERNFMVQAFSRQGLSGAPVFAVQRGLKFGDGLAGPAHREARLIGVNAGHFGADDDGPAVFSYAVRSDVVLEVLAHWLEIRSAAGHVVNGLEGDFEVVPGIVSKNIAS